jgi:hypothetical protein
MATAMPAMGQEVPNPQHVPLAVEVGNVETMRVTLGRRAGYGQRDNCPESRSHTTSSFSGGTYTAQGGFAEGEIAAASYTLPGSLFPLKITLMEWLIAQQNAVVTTTTAWSVIVYDGFPTDPQPAGFPVIFSSDGTILPHVVMGPGTRGTNVQASVDPGDPEQIFISNPDNLANKSFTVAFRIDQHNQQTADPCFTPPPASHNAFPATDNTVIGCGSGYAQLQQPSQNWLYAVNCGANGCPPNGGWTRFSGLQTDLVISPFCFTGCRPRGDWMIRVTFDPVNCPPPTGACCFGTAGCFVTDQASCQTAGGTYRGAGTVCGTPGPNGFPGCQPPPNNQPVAQAGSDQSLTDTNGDGMETFVVDGSGSTDPDAGDFIANYRWTEGATLLQDGPALLSATLPVGVHTLTLQVTDSFGLTDTDDVVVTINPGGGGGCDPDVNQDGNVDQGDVDYLVNVIGGGENPTGIDPDFNRDGNVDQGDIDALLDVVAGGPCP